MNNHKYYKKQRKILYELLNNEDTKTFIIDTGLLPRSIVNEIIDDPRFNKGMEPLSSHHIYIKKGRFTVTFE